MFCGGAMSKSPTRSCETWMKAMPPLNVMSKLSVSGRAQVTCGATATSLRFKPDVEPVTVLGRLKKIGSGTDAEVVASLDLPKKDTSRPAKKSWRTRQAPSKDATTTAPS